MTTEILISIIGIIIIILIIPDDGITSEMKKEFKLFTEKERGQIHVDNTGSSVEMRDLTLPELAESRISENNSRINHIKNEIPLGSSNTGNQTKLKFKKGESGFF